LELLAQLPDAGNGTRITVAGDSWAWVVAGGSDVAGSSFLNSQLKRHDCDFQTSSIAVPGTMTTDWNHGTYLSALKLAAQKSDYIFFILMGNDALMDMPDCAQDKTKTSAECGNQLVTKVMKNMGDIADAIHEANPNTRLVGFGYDTMFGGLGCSLVTHQLFPQCWRASSQEPVKGNRCFNTQFLRIQDIWDSMASSRSWVDSASILGATQVAGGNIKASTADDDRHIDMDAMGPAKYWPDYEACFHPGVLGGDDSGAAVTMAEFYKVYWSKQPLCNSRVMV
jgi:hypothetical protein